MAICKYHFTNTSLDMNNFTAKNNYQRAEGEPLLAFIRFSASFKVS